MTAALAVPLAGCGGLPPLRVQLGAGDGGISRAASDLIAADEPQAVLVARDILLAGGSAADAAVALGFALAVTLPSSAGLGGSGACIAHDASSGATEALDFTARAGADDGAPRYRAAIPALPRGLFALHARYGNLPWGQVVAPAENLARFGHRVSRALARDLTGDGAALVNDRSALMAFMSPRWQMLQSGDALTQIDLATSLGRLRARGPGDIYAGTLGREVEESIAAAGGAVTAEDFRAYLPRWITAAQVDEGEVRLYVLPPAVAGGDFQSAFAAAARSALPTAGETAVSGSTGFVVADVEGNMVACALTMGQPFGLGIMPAGTGFLLAPSPDAPVGDAPGMSRQTLAPMIAISRANNRVASAVVAAGADAELRVAALARAVIVDRHTIADVFRAVEKPGASSNRRSGLINMLSCSPSENATPLLCQALNDPRGAGYAFIHGP